VYILKKLAILKKGGLYRSCVIKNSIARDVISILNVLWHTACSI